MANFTFTAATRTIGATEYSLARDANYSSASPMTTQGYVSAVIDRSALVTGDAYILTVYEKAGAAATQRPLLDPMYVIPGTSLYTVNAGLLGDGWDITLRLATGAQKSIPFSVRVDTNDVNALTAGASAVSAIAAAVMGGAIEGALTLTGSMRLLLSQAVGKLIISGSSYVFRDTADTKNRITGTAVDTTGRTGISLDAT